MKNLKRLVPMALVLVVAGIVASVALASGGVTIEQGNSWDAFPAQSQPGDTLSVTKCIFQSGAEGSHATAIFGGLKAAGLTFVGNGDGSASHSQTANKATITYTDFAHSAKCDSYTFTLANDQAPGVYPVHFAIVIDGVGQKSETLNVTIPAPVVPTPPTPAAPITQAYVQQAGHIAACASAPVVRADASMTSGTFLDLDVDTFDAGTFEGITFTPAIYEQGVGLTCDTPTFFHDAGVKVDSLGVTQSDGGNPYELYVR